jgi:hypothetical protein
MHRVFARCMGAGLSLLNPSYCKPVLQEELRLDAELLRLALTSRDCAALLPGGGRDTGARVAALERLLAELDAELADAEAQHRLYSLLAERTRCASGWQSHHCTYALACRILRPLPWL